jgi:O-antigen/teichoic acid export membrane protein
MHQESRTEKSVKNSRVAMLWYCLFLVLTFFSRRVFIERLGGEVLGLSTAATNLLSCLNLAEMGIGTAIAFSLYRPLAEGDRVAVGEIVSVQGWLYRRIAWFVMAGGVVAMCFFPWFFAKAQVVVWYPYATFVVLMASSLAGYFFNYRQVVVTADQCDYRLLMVTQGARNGKLLLQIAAITWLAEGYVWWLVLELVATVATVAGIERLIRRRYPWLKTNVHTGGELRRRYPHIISKTKQLFFHRVGGLILTQTSPLVIYGFTSLTMVAVYENYMFIVLGIVAIVNALLGSVTAGVGNLVASATKEKVERFFGEMFSFRFFLAGVACVAMWMLAPSFVTLWVGGEYLLDGVSVGLLVAIMYVLVTRGTVDMFVTASGLFHDIWAPVVEAVLNLGLSIALGSMFGLRGVLAGVLISLLVVVKGWKPWFFFSRWLKVPFGKYLTMYGRHVVAAAVAVALFVPVVRLMRLWGVDPAGSYLRFAAYGALIVVVFGVLLAGSLWLFTPGMRDCVVRARDIVKLMKR